MRCHTGNISFGSLLLVYVIFAENTVAYVIYAWHESVVVDIHQYGQ